MFGSIVELIVWHYFFGLHKEVCLDCLNCFRLYVLNLLCDKGFAVSTCANSRSLRLLRLFATVVEDFNRCSDIKSSLLKVMWVSFGLFFMFSIFYQLDSHKTCVALADLSWSISKNWIENWTCPDLVMACCCYSTKCIGPPNCVQYRVWSS